MRRSASTAPVFGMSLNALLLIGSIRSLARVLTRRRGFLPDCEDCNDDSRARTDDPLQFRKRNSSPPGGEGTEDVDGADHDRLPRKKAPPVAERREERDAQAAVRHRIQQSVRRTGEE